MTDSGSSGSPDHTSISVSDGSVLDHMSQPASDSGPGTLDASSPPAGDSGILPTPDGSTPWLAYINSPPTRTLSPIAVIGHGTVTGADSGALSGQTIRITGSNSGITFDFGREVGGIASVMFGTASDAAQTVGLSFCESSEYIGPSSDGSSGHVYPDAAYYQTEGFLSAAVTPSSTYVMPTDKLRGGFRYMSIYLNTTGWVEVTGVTLNFTPAPAMSVPNQYPNYFYSNDDLLNRIWYAGAYTIQMDTVDPHQGRAWPAPTTGWEDNATIGTGTSVLVDGAKRDRTVWPGDLGVAIPTAYVSLGDLTSTMNSLNVLYAGQNTTTGEFQRSGPPLHAAGGTTNSDTYHLWTLIGAYNYYLYSGDKAWVDAHWAAHKKGVAFSTAKIGASGLLGVTLVSDWGRLGMSGENIEANAIMYQVLVTSAALATVEGDTAQAATYTTQAATLKAAANATLWNAAAGGYHDNPTSTLIPQDGNSLSVWFGLVDDTTKAPTLLATLKKNWNTYGSQTPEGDPTKAMISPFPGSMEVAARFIANDDQDALDLIRLEWGYMLSSPKGAGGTFWEGYQADGSLGYGGAYMSHAHGWSSGPTFAMTQWVLGVAPDSAAGQTFHVIPHVGDLTHVEGLLTIATGKTVSVSYDHAMCGDFNMTVDSSTNTGSVGVVGIPKFGLSPVVQVNGATVWDGTQYVTSPAATSADEDANFIYFRGMSPGKAVFNFYPKQCT